MRNLNATQKHEHHRQQVFGMCQSRICTSTIATIIIPYHTSWNARETLDVAWEISHFSNLMRNESAFKMLAGERKSFFFSFLISTESSVLWISVETRFGSRFKNNSNFPLLIESEMQSKAHNEQMKNQHATDEDWNVRDSWINIAIIMSYVSLMRMEFIRFRSANRYKLTPSIIIKKRRNKKKPNTFISSLPKLSQHIIFDYKHFINVDECDD